MNKIIFGLLAIIAVIFIVVYFLPSKEGSTVAEPEETTPEKVEMSVPEKVEKPVPEKVEKPVPEKVEKPVVKQLDGDALYNTKGCVACHGADAKTSIMLSYPKLAGQSKEYAVTQMKDIKSGARNNGLTVVMKGIMGSVSDAEMEAIAEWLASLPNEVKSDATLAAKGGALYNSKTCIACHGADGQTPIMPSYPKLAGQSKEYAVAQMKDIKSGARNNGMTAVMKGIMASVSDAEMEDIAEWLVSPM
ncbi:MAG: cytochrome c [Pseudomonadota bacterium]